MSDIPPELLEEAKRVCAEYRQLEQADRLMLRCCRWMCWLVVAIALIVLCSTCAHAATFDPSDTYCELFAQDPDNGRYYIVQDPLWTPACANPWVTVRTAKFQALVDAYEGGSGTTLSAFTDAEIAALKFQAANPSPFNLTPLAGTLISFAVAGVWGVGWSFRALLATLRDDSSTSTE